jgi:hypothetical protein
VALSWRYPNEFISQLYRVFSFPMLAVKMESYRPYQLLPHVSWGSQTLPILAVL